MSEDKLATLAEDKLVALERMEAVELSASVALTDIGEKAAETIIKKVEMENKNRIELAKIDQETKKEVAKLQHVEPIRVLMQWMVPMACFAIFGVFCLIGWALHASGGNVNGPTAGVLTALVTFAGGTVYFVDRLRKGLN